MSYFLVLDYGYEGLYIQQYVTKEEVEVAFREEHTSMAIIEGREIKIAKGSKILWDEIGKSFV